MKIFYKIVLLITLLLPNTLFAAIDFNVTPIRYELDAAPWDSITQTATLTNKWTGSFSIITGKSDFEPTGNTGSPRFVRYSELVHPDQQISSWITIDTPGFVIGWNSSQTVNFTIDVPSDATPGGHYGAVFFKNNASETSSGWTVGINVDYGILVLLNVSGTVVSSGSVDPSWINVWTGGGYDKCEWKDTSWSRYDKKCSPDDTDTITDTSNDVDDCIIDFTPSNFDGKCFNSPFENTENETGNETENVNDEDFNIVFDVPFKNDGNTHIKPEWTIVVKDENGDIIKGIGEKLIKNELWAIVWKEIVDFLPINDEEWNVLPSSIRNFIYEWKWFPYRDVDGIIKYRTPGEYYTLKNVNASRFLMFWERVCIRKKEKTLTADIDVSYINNKGEEIEFNSAKEFKIRYIEQYIGINPYVVVPVLLLLFILGIWWWFILAFKRKTCINKECGKKIKRKYTVCPHCEAIQDKKKFKQQKSLWKKKKPKKIKKK